MSEVGADGVCAHFRVRGLVQGVFFRASTEQTALRLGLTGWVRNCANGDVELVACGTPRQLDALEQWLWQGPPAARVEVVERSAAPPEAFPGFSVRR
jgi:acylphosphatase